MNLFFEEGCFLTSGIIEAKDEKPYWDLPGRSLEINIAESDAWNVIIEDDCYPSSYPQYLILAYNSTVGIQQITAFIIYIMNK